MGRGRAALLGAARGVHLFHSHRRGTRLKIFEAMSMAKAVVSTSIGAEGLPVKNGEHLLLADDPGAFAESTLRLLGDASQRAQIGQAARQSG